MKTIQYTDSGGKRVVAIQDGRICGDAEIITYDDRQGVRENHFTAAKLLSDLAGFGRVSFISKTPDETVWNWKTQSKRA